MVCYFWRSRRVESISISEIIGIISIRNIFYIMYFRDEFFFLFYVRVKRKVFLECFGVYL